MENRAFSRYTITLFILFGYLLPVLGFSFLYSDSQESWFLLGLGLLMAASGSLLFFGLFLGWESEVIQEQETESLEEPEKASEPSPEFLKELESQKLRLEELEKALKDKEQQNFQLSSQLEAKAGEIESVFSENRKQAQIFQDQQANLQADFSEQRRMLLDEIDKLRTLLIDHNQTILEQRENLERKSQQMTQLENKVRDLNYELKTILHLSEKTISLQETAPPPPVSPVYRAKHEELRPFVDSAVHTEEEASLQLKRCLDVAQGMTGASHFGSNSRFREFSAGHFALDQRRLFDRLRTEEASTIFVYSLQDSRMLFVNDQVKLLLGLTAERFVQGFAEIAQPGLENWNEALRQLSFRNEVHIQLPLKSRFGEEIIVDCLLGIIPTGLFRNQIIGIIYAPAHLHERSNSV
ncbi:MAG: hypothetical protein LLG04_03195 [Parachlamydia sp.]|nr:hypothetical protein [Parachlamydia sp.]